MALSPEWTFRDRVENLGGGLEYTESKDSRETGFTENDASTERIYFVKAGPDLTTLAAFMDALVGYSRWEPQEDIPVAEVVGAPPVMRPVPPLLRRVLPDRHSIWRNWYCTKANVEGMGVAGKTANVHPVPEHALCRVRAFYQPVDYLVASDEAVTLRFGPGLIRSFSREYQRFCRFIPENNTEFLTLHGAMKFVTSGRALDAPPAKLHSTKLLTIEWLKVPAYGDNPFGNPVEITDLANRGRLNAFGFLGFNPGTVLYLGAKTKVVTPPLGNDTYYHNITFNFAIKDNGSVPGPPVEWIGHNWLWDVPNNRWDLVTHNGLAGGTRAYQENGRFEDLFRPFALPL